MRRLGLDEHQVDLAIRLYEQGWSVARIGSHCGVNGGTVWLAHFANETFGCGVPRDGNGSDNIRTRQPG